MEKYIEDLLTEYEVSGRAATPAKNNLFIIDDDSPLLDPVRAKQFHSRVAKILYCCKRIKLDTLPTVAFLTTRVQSPTEQDWTKLNRLLRYINATKNAGIVLEGSDDWRVHMWTDASYGVHSDGKSHTGSLISLGKGAIYVKSGKQKIVSKSSTEAELIGLSDSASQAIWTRDFLTYQGYKMPPAAMYQDNTSTITLTEKGYSTAERTRHINIRYFFIKDRVETGELEIIYLPTKEMIADILTKPLQGSLFSKLRRLLLNWK